MPTMKPRAVARPNETGAATVFMRQISVALADLDEAAIWTPGAYSRRQDIRRDLLRAVDSLFVNGLAERNRR